MRIRHSFDLRKFVIFTYFSALLVYLIFGFMPAGAANYEVSARINIPAIDLVSDVTELDLNGRKLETPDYIVGSYSNAENKTLLIGHRSTVFTNLNQALVGDAIWYNGRAYLIKKTEMFKKSEINMDRLLKSEETDTLVIMTCAGEDLENGDATHRLIVTATVL